ncbi:unnamed protein product [Albugo candida]|uniref:Uncharacterized protein n=1 Tax=Albugo candida TaxID=65357 RepID=A0A024G5D2_9STRA|nr:unnamed protein product [Albugo candida]|eukprot:CCI41514.1 unnamed protein product [Albugo candida]
MSDPLVLRLVTIMYHIYHVSTGLQSGILKVQVSDARHGMASCQTCVLDTLGAKRMKLESYWKVYGVLFATYEISGPDFVFANLNFECTSYKKCIVQELEMFPLKNWQTTASEEPIISPNNALWFILGYTSSAKVLCMTCLQQNAVARSVGKFRLTSKIGGDHNIYVVHDAKKNIERKLCNDVCTTLYTPKHCGNFLDLLRALPFEDKQRSSPSKIHHEAAKESDFPSHNALQCLWTQKVRSDRCFGIEQCFCRGCIAVHYGTATFSTRINRTTWYIYLLR